MTISLEDKINNVLSDVRIAVSDIQSGTLVDLVPLESRVKDICHSVSDNKQQPQLADRGALHRHLTALMDSLDYLEKLVTTKKEGLDPPASPLETA